MENQTVTVTRLKALPWLEREITWSKKQLADGNLVSESSVREWATQAAGVIPAEDYEKAIRAVKDTRERLKHRIEYATHEVESLITWLNAIPKEDIRACMYLHYAKRYSWDVIADQYYGGSVTGSAVKSACQRYLAGVHQGKRGRPRKDGEKHDKGTA